MPGKCRLVHLEASLSVSLPATSVAARMARHAGRALGALLPVERSEELELLLTEVVTNSVRHADAPVENEVSVDVLLFSDLVRVEVRDRGRGFSLPASIEPPEGEDAGWGLALVERLADRWGVAEDPPTLVWFEFDRSDERPAPAGDRSGVAWPDG